MFFLIHIDLSMKYLKFRGHSYQKVRFIFNSLYQFFRKIIIRNVPWQNVIDFRSDDMEAFLVNVHQYLLIYGIDNK